MHEHCGIATDYRKQMMFLEKVYNEERRAEIEKEQAQLREYLGSEQVPVAEVSKPRFAHLKTYRSRTDKCPDDEEVDTTEKILQFPWTP